MVDRNELQPRLPYSPEYKFSNPELSQPPMPNGFREVFEEVKDGLYPNWARDMLSDDDSYDPLIIGYETLGKDNLKNIMDKLEGEDADVKVMTDITPKTLAEPDSPEAIAVLGVLSHKALKEIDPASALSAISRDSRRLKAIYRGKPEVIIVDALQALKYDLLMRRGGERTVYYLDKPLDWSAIVDSWGYAHQTAEDLVKQSPA